MRASLPVFVGMKGKARNRPTVSTLFATLLAREHPTPVSSIQHLLSSLNSKKMLIIGGVEGGAGHREANWALARALA